METGVKRAASRIAATEGDKFQVSLEVGQFADVSPLKRGHDQGVLV